ncbi:glycosyltransferase family 2 protein [Demequina sp.]|uniref:glycosyltransferase family 2 protein n=1 Tax=Demequina sp. TaxID=2050685 RepID=UPI003D0E6E9F
MSNALPDLDAERAPVSVVMPVLNEERYLAGAVEAVLDNGYPGPLELVIGLGPSTDGTDAIAEHLAADPRVVLVANPTGATPSGLNLAIAASRNPVVIRTDGHARLPHGYLAQAVAALARTGAGNVGGRMVPTSDGVLGKAIAVAMSSPWGIGGAGHRVGGAEGSAASVYLGAFRREALAAVGGYDEHFRRAQDWELNYRLRHAGFDVWFVPSMQVPYEPRRTWRALARQFHESGRWRREVARVHPDSKSLRYLAAPIAALAVAGGLVLGVVGLATGLSLLALGFVAPVGYLAGVLLASATHVRDLPLRSLLLLPGVLATMHMAWGTGYLRGIG